MAIQVQCPNADCGKILTVRDEFAGKIGKCPGCGGAVKIPAEQVEEVVEELPVAKRAPRDEDAPASPRRTRRRAEDDDDEERRPARRRTRAEDDDEDDYEERRPRRRRRDEDDDDDDYDDDYDRVRRRKPKKAAPTATVVCLGIAAGLFLCLGFTPLFSMFSFSVPNNLLGGTLKVSSMIALTEGKIVMIFSFVAAAVLIATLIVAFTVSPNVSNIFVTVAIAVTTGLGLALVLWLVGFIWDVFACNAFNKGVGGGPRGDVEMSPGIGLWIGLGLAIGAVATFSTLSSLRGRTLWLYVGEGAGLLLGVLLLTLNVQPWSQGDINKPQDIKFVKRYFPLIDLHPR